MGVAVEEDSAGMALGNRQGIGTALAAESSGRVRTTRNLLESLAFPPAAALAIAWCVASLSFPFSWDHGLFAWVGDVINRGGMPYRDAWDIKGPFAHYTFAAAEWIFGRRMMSIRIVDLLFVAVTVVLVARFVSGAAHRQAGRWASVLFILWYASGSYWHTAQPDGEAGMILAVAFLWLALPESRLSLWRLAVAGFLVGCATLIKPLYAVFLAVAVIYAVSLIGRNYARIATAFAVTCASFLVPLVLMATWFYHQGAWSDLVDVYLVYPLVTYAGTINGPVMARVRGLLDYILAAPVIVVLLPAIGVGLAKLWHEKRSLAWLLLTWAVGAVFIVVLQNRFFTYHWLPALPPLTILAVVGFSGILERFREATPLVRTFVYLTLAVVLLHAAVRPLADVGAWIAHVVRGTSAIEYYGHFGVPQADVAAAEYIAAHTTEQDRVLAWGWNPMIYFVSGRRTPGRFGYSMPLLQDPTSPRCQAYQREFMSEVRSHTPVYIIEDPRAVALLGGNYDRGNFKEFDEFVSQHYRRETQIGELILYRLMPQS